MDALIENILIMIAAVLVLVGGAYLALVLLNLAMKFKGGLREDEGLVDLWAEVQKQQKSAEQPEDMTDDSQPLP